MYTLALLTLFPSRTSSMSFPESTTTKMSCQPASGESHAVVTVALVLSGSPGTSTSVPMGSLFDGSPS